MDRMAVSGKKTLPSLKRIGLHSHFHLLLYDNGGNNVIPNSIKLVAGRTGQEYNFRKNRKGAFWQDRYHATAAETNRY